jgi:hypothetical protein
MGVKYDSGKTRPSLVILSMSRALQAVSEVAMIEQISNFRKPFPPFGTYPDIPRP